MEEQQSTNIVIIGHVDHGKSTLIGRLLYDTSSINPQLMDEIEKPARKLRKKPEFAFLMDSLQEEREEGITIDIMHSCFRSMNSYNIIDVPGHKQFIKNMITGASKADAAILVVSAKSSEGVQEQTKRHIFLVRFLGIEQVFVVINKMDAVDYKRDLFSEVSKRTRGFLEAIGYDSKQIPFIPVSAIEGDNISNKSNRMNWYKGPTLIESLDKMIIPPESPIRKPLRMPVQDIYKIEGKTIIIGKVETGILQNGKKVVFQPTDIEGEVEKIESFNQEKHEAIPGDSIGLSLRCNNIEDIKRGDVCGNIENPPHVREGFIGYIFLLSDIGIKKDEELILQCGMSETTFSITEITHKINSETSEIIKEICNSIKPNEAGVIRVSLKQPIVLEKFSDIPNLGRFIIIKNNKVVAAGKVIDF